MISNFIPIKQCKRIYPCLLSNESQQLIVLVEDEDSSYGTVVHVKKGCAAVIGSVISGNWELWKPINGKVVLENSLDEPESVEETFAALFK